MERKQPFPQVLEIMPWIDDHIFHLQITRILASLFYFQLESGPTVMVPRVYWLCKGLWNVRDVMKDLLIPKYEKKPGKLKWKTGQLNAFKV